VLVGREGDEARVAETAAAAAAAATSTSSAARTCGPEVAFAALFAPRRAEVRASLERRLCSRDRDASCTPVLATSRTINGVSESVSEQFLNGTSAHLFNKFTVAQNRQSARQTTVL